MPTKATPIEQTIELSKKLGVSEDDTREIIGAYRNFLAKTLKKSGQVVIQGLGALHLKICKKRLHGLNGKKPSLRTFKIGSFRIAPNLK